jgi:hypothetical protein
MNPKDGFDALIDFLKQVITLSSASIVVVASLLDRFARAPYVRWSVKLALIAFGLSVASALLSIFMVSGKLYSSPGAAEGLSINVTAKLMIVSFVCLLGGISFLVLFACYNF